MIAVDFDKIGTKRLTDTPVLWAMFSYLCTIKVPGGGTRPRIDFYAKYTRPLIIKMRDTG